MKKIAFEKYTQGDYLLGRGKDQAILASFLLFCRIRHRSSGGTSSSNNNGGGRSSGCISKSTDWKYLMLNVDVKQREHPRAGPKAGHLAVCSRLLPGHRFCRGLRGQFQQILFDSTPCGMGQSSCTCLEGRSYRTFNLQPLMHSGTRGVCR